MKRIIALILTVLMCFSIVACGKNKKNEEPTLSPEEITDLKSQVVGDWYDTSSTKSRITFNQNGTGSMDYEGTEQSFSWSYDEEADSLYIKVSDKKFNIDLVKRDGLTYVSLSGTWFFKEADLAAGKAAVLSERRAGIAKDLDGKAMLKAGQDIKVSDSLSVRINSISNVGKKTVLEMTLKNTSSATASLTSIGNLIYLAKTKCYMASPFSTVYLDKLGTAPTVENGATELAAGAEVKLSIELFSTENFDGVVNYWGEVNAYRSIMIGNSEYYVDLSK